MEIINDQIKKEVKGNEAITLALVCATLAVSILIVVGWKIYQSTKGSVTIPGGFKFNWGSIRTLPMTLLKYLK